jgi:hypothetical protein
MTEKTNSGEAFYSADATMKFQLDILGVGDFRE